VQRADLQATIPAIWDGPGGHAGVRSRRELVATAFRQRYLPRIKAGDPRSPTGYFE